MIRKQVNWEKAAVLFPTKVLYLNSSSIEFGVLILLIICPTCEYLYIMSQSVVHFCTVHLRCASSYQMKCDLICKEICTFKMCIITIFPGDFYISGVVSAVQYFEFKNYRPHAIHCQSEISGPNVWNEKL